MRCVPLCTLQIIMLVKDFMTTSVSVSKASDPVPAVIDIMRRENIGIVPVCDLHNHLLGIVTDRDILLRAFPSLDSTTEIVQSLESLPVSAVMSKKIITVSPKDNIHDAAIKFSEAGVRRLPVMENDRLVGMLSLKDLAEKRMMIAELGHIIYEISNYR